MNHRVAGLCKHREHADLDESDAAGEALRRVEAWSAPALEARRSEPSTMTVATVGADASFSPRARLARRIDAQQGMDRA